MNVLVADVTLTVIGDNMKLCKKCRAQRSLAMVMYHKQRKKNLKGKTKYKTSPVKVYRSRSTGEILKGPKYKKIKQKRIRRLAKLEKQYGKEKAQYYMKLLKRWELI